MSVRKNTRRLLTIAVLLTSAACTRIEQLPSSADPSLAWAALVERTADGTLERASPLHPWPAGQGLPVFAPEDRDAWVLAWSEDALEAAAIREIPASSGTPPLRAPATCEATLPAPTWAARWSPSSALVEATDDPIARAPLTADWLTARCTRPADLPIRVSVDCLDHRCEPRVRSTGACSFELDLSACDRDRISGAVHPDDALCLGPEADAPACPVHAYVRPESPPFVVDRVKLDDRFGGFVPEFLGYNGLLIPDLLLQGFAWELAIANAGVVVAVGDGATDEPCRFGEPRAVHLDTYDPATLQRTTSAQAPDCFTHFRATPSSELVGTFVEGRTWMIGKVAANGTVLSRAPLDDRANVAATDPRRATFGAFRVVDIELLPAVRRIAVLLAPSEDDGKSGDGGNLLFTYDLETLEPKSRFDYARGQRWSMAAATDRVLAVLSNDQRAIGWLDVDTGTAAASLRLTRIEGLVHDDSLLDVRRDASTGNLLVAGTRDPLVFTAAPLGRELARDTDDDLDLEPTLTIDWPNEQSRALVAGVGRDEAGYPAYVAVFDTRTSRYLPGTFRVGTGAPTRAAIDGAGRAFILLPWSGELVRLTPL